MSTKTPTLKTFFVRLQQVCESGNDPSFVPKMLELELKDGLVEVPGSEPFMLELPSRFEEVVLRWKGGSLIAEVRRMTECPFDGADSPNAPLESDSIKSRNELVQEIAPHVSMSRSGAAETFTFHVDPEQPKECKSLHTEALVSGIQKIEGMLIGVNQTLEKHSYQLDTLLAQSERNQSLERKVASRNSSAIPGAKKLFGIQDVLESTATSPPRLIMKTVSPSPQVQAFSVNEARSRKTRVALTGLSGALQRLNNTQDKQKVGNLGLANLSVEKPRVIGGGSLLVQSKHALSTINKLIAGVRPRSKKSRRVPSQTPPHGYSTDPRSTYPCPAANTHSTGHEDKEDDLHTIIRDQKGLTEHNSKQPLLLKNNEQTKKYWLLPNPRHLHQVTTD